MEVSQLGTFMATECEGMRDQTGGGLLDAVNATDWLEIGQNFRPAKSMPILASQAIRFCSK
jgi:hypothetical protein